MVLDGWARTLRATGLARTGGRDGADGRLRRGGAGHGGGSSGIGRQHATVVAAAAVGLLS